MEEKGREQAFCDPPLASSPPIISTVPPYYQAAIVSVPPQYNAIQMREGKEKSESRALTWWKIMVFFTLMALLAFGLYHVYAMRRANEELRDAQRRTEQVHREWHKGRRTEASSSAPRQSIQSVALLLSLAFTLPFILACVV